MIADKSTISNRGRAGWARRTLSTGVIAASALAIAPVAWAANADTLEVKVTVKPVDEDSAKPTVSVSRSNLSSFISVQFKVKNGGTNTINKVVVEGTTKVFSGGAASPTLSSDYSAFVNLGPGSPNCTLPSANKPTTAVKCTIGQLASQQERNFFVIFKAPPAGDTIEFNAHTAFSSGNSDNTPPADFIRDQPTSIVLTTIETFQVNHKVKTVLPPDGGDFFTGQNATTNSLNPFSTKVTVPKVTGLVTDNSIVEGVPSPVACGTLENPNYFCFGFNSTIEVNNASDNSKVYFPDDATAPVLKIYLRQDVTALGKPYPDIATIKIFYLSPIATQKSEVKSCQENPGLPIANVPCVQSRTDAVKGNKGYYEYLIYAKDNGVYSW